MKSLLLIIFAFNICAVEDFNEESAKGKSKYQRITQIEKYLSTLSSSISSKLDKDLEEINDRLKNLEQKKEDSNIKKTLSKLKESISILKIDIEKKHKEDTDELRALIVKLDKNQDEKRELVTSSILKKILALDRVISGFGKLPKSLTPTKTKAP